MSKTNAQLLSIAQDAYYAIVSGHAQTKTIEVDGRQITYNALNIGELSKIIDKLEARNTASSKTQNGFVYASFPEKGRFQ